LLRHPQLFAVIESISSADRSRGGGHAAQHARRISDAAPTLIGRDKHDHGALGQRRSIRRDNDQAHSLERRA